MEQKWYEKAWAWIKSTAKASMAGIGAIFTFFLAAGILNPDMTPVEAFFDTISKVGDFSVTQWSALVIAVLAAYGITWAMPNRYLPGRQ